MSQSMKAFFSTVTFPIVWFFRRLADEGCGMLRKESFPRDVLAEKESLLPRALTESSPWKKLSHRFLCKMETGEESAEDVRKRKLVEV